ncbi:MAG: hypothetical protein R3338_03570 [Thermoanaerobaculia bacterium]|nr:hypothetical protein [Thermoanaerobaculia bacterium]
MRDPEDRSRLTNIPILRSVPRAIGALVIVGIFAFPAEIASCQESFQVSGFAWLRGATDPDDPILLEEDFSAQIQAGLEWYFSPVTRAHLHVLGRDDRTGSRDENFGIVEAYLETIFRPADDKLRVRAGAFFLPTSREHVDALWENPYSITPSALNAWMGEELRPIGVDLDYSRGSFHLGATLFGWNDAFGTLPAVRGWRLRNHVALIDETIVGRPDALSRISVDTDDRPGWSVRGRWSTTRSLVQYTYIDNRAGGGERSGVVPWRTPFHILSAEWDRGNWTVAAESGWGETWIPGLERFTEADLRASYLLVSRRFDRHRASLRIDEMAVDDDDDLGLTLAWLWRPSPKIRATIEMTALDDDIRAMAEVRTYFFLR